MINVRYNKPHHRVSASLQIHSLTSNVVKTLVLYSLAEHQQGHARRIDVCADGRSFIVRDDGRGHAVTRNVEGAPYLDFIYQHLQYPFAEGVARPIQLHGLGMSFLNQMCESLQVRVQKADVTLTISFACGTLVRKQVIDANNHQTGTELTGVTVDMPETVGGQQPSLEQWLRAVRASSSGLVMSFNGHFIVGNGDK